MPGSRAIKKILQISPDLGSLAVSSQPIRVMTLPNQPAQIGGQSGPTQHGRLIEYNILVCYCCSQRNDMDAQVSLRLIAGSPSDAATLLMARGNVLCLGRLLLNTAQSSPATCMIHQSRDIVQNGTVVYQMFLSYRKQVEDLVLVLSIIMSRTLSSIGLYSRFRRLFRTCFYNLELRPEFGYRIWFL